MMPLHVDNTLEFNLWFKTVILTLTEPCPRGVDNRHDVRRTQCFHHTVDDVLHLAAVERDVCYSCNMHSTHSLYSYMNQLTEQKGYFNITTDWNQTNTHNCIANAIYRNMNQVFCKTTNCLTSIRWWLMNWKCCGAVIKNNKHIFNCD